MMKTNFLIVLALTSVAAFAGTQQPMTPANTTAAIGALKEMGVKGQEMEGVNYDIKGVVCLLNMMAGPTNPPGTPGNIRMERSYTCSYRDMNNGHAKDTQAGVNPATLADAISQTLNGDSALAGSRVTAAEVHCTAGGVPMGTANCTVSK